MSWPLPRSETELLQLAYRYPYRAPPSGYLLRDGELAPLEEAAFAGRFPVLAHGSNRAPEQLARKFPHGEIPVTRGWLSDHMVVYAACLTRYGACPSLLYYRQGVNVRLSINWLTCEQLAFMHRTEGAYSFGALEADFVPEEGPLPDGLLLYHGNHGALLLGGAPTALAAVEACGVMVPLRPQEEVLVELQRLAGDAGSPDDFVLRMIRHPQQRARFTRRLAEHSRSDALPGFRALEEAASLTP